MNSTLAQRGDMSEVRYPRVLIISRAAISAADTSGISRGRWFQLWPKDRIAQIYSSDAGSGSPFCPIRYEFGGKDRRFGRLFGSLKHSSWGDAFRVQRVVAARPSPIRRAIRRAKAWIVGRVAASGLCEAAFATRVSKPLVGWCRAFQPDIIFSTCTDLSYAELTLQLAEVLRIPVCLQIEDDWFGALYARGLPRIFLRGRTERLVRRLIAVSSVRFSLGHLMSEAYLRDHGSKFEPLYVCDDIGRFDRVPARTAERPSGLTIVYSGSLVLDRWEGLMDLDQALDSLPPEIGPVRIVVFASHVPAEAIERLKSRPRIELRAGLADAAVPCALKEADVVFLPESFHAKWRTHIRYSISSKSHLYMMSGRPAIVYGPPGIGVVEYARGDNWAEVVDERSPARLAGVVATLLTDRAKVADLVARARAVALRNHDARQVREQFRQALIRCANGVQSDVEAGDAQQGDYSCR